jgi:carboxyl-terminal processing protease
MERAVDSLRERGARSLVLDLRGNAGGLFEEGVQVAGLFLPRGSLVASLDARRGAAPQPHLSRNSRWPTMPLTLLVDAGTASAAEVIAAALRDHDRALLVGAPTYGKGVVQRVVKLTNDLSLRLTTARWLTPRGISLERRQGSGADAHGGMLPDVLLDDASRKDAFSLPREWPAAAIIELSGAADSAAVQAIRDGWASAPLALLEARLRSRLSLAVPRAVRGAPSRANWVNVATRVATVRTLEISGSPEALLRYAVRDDAALRAGLDVFAPGSEIARVVPSTATSAPGSK